MNPNMSIYRQLNPRPLVQDRVGLGLLHWANTTNISLTVATSDLYVKIAFKQMRQCH